MKHLGDITKLKGNEVPLVDIVTGGSPCQDLSVAGKREGLAGERSGLFMEQIRLIKEMRESDRADGRTDEYIRPRYMVWENVPGAFSSNKGEDFRCVLEETAKVADSNAIIPRLATGKDGKQKWSKSGCIMGDGWSIAWRVHDAQFWGVPQRRKRISLVADFGGDTAPEILFEREGVSGNTAESREQGQSSATDVRTGIEETGRAVSFQERAGKPGGGKGILIQNERTGALSTLNNQSVCAFEPGAASRLGGYCWEDKAGTLRANAGDNQQAVVYGIGSYDSNAMKSDNPHSGIYEADTSRTLDLNGGNPACNQGGMAVVQGADVYNGELTGEVAATLTNACGGSNTSGAKVVCIEGNGQRESHKGDGYKESDTMYTLNTVEQHAVAYRKTSHAKTADDGQGWQETEINDTLNAFDSGESRTPTVIVEGFDNYNMSLSGEKAKTLQSEGGGSGVNEGCVLIENHPQDSRVKIREDGICQTLDARMGMGGGNVPMVMEQPITASKASYFMKQHDDGVAETLVATDYKDPQLVAYGLDRAAFNQGINAQYDFRVEEEKIGTQVAKGPGAVCQSVVRRLTPLECERLQGFPDTWTDIGDWVDSKGKKHKGESDSPRYKALGNSIALPFWQYLADKMCAYLKEPTMASLFDGIGGFPLVYLRSGCEPIWASEIEEFPIAVTKIRFKEEVEE